VNKKTEILVAGEKVGASKLNKAEQLGTTILSESDYLALLAQ
jgi:DNA ligase (NAD+)